jgi:hypothetical protein
VRTINESGNIAVESYGHINDDGSISNNRLSITVLAPVRQLHAEPAKTAEGPDAVTHEEVDAALAGAGIPEQPEGVATPPVDDAGGLNNEPATTA